jgi:hypothetical protein
VIKILEKDTIPKQVEQSIYKQIHDEIKKKNFDDTCYMKALSKADGDEKKAKGHYIKIRFEELWETYIEETEKFFKENKDRILREQHKAFLQKKNEIIKLIKKDPEYNKSSAKYKTQLLNSIDKVLNLPDTDENRIELAESIEFVRNFISRYNRGKTTATSISMKHFGVNK